MSKLQKCLVTGGAGFIGSNLVKHLIRENFQVTVIDNLSSGNLDNIKPFSKDINFIKADISKNGKWNKEFKCKDVIFHLAALADIVPSINYPEKYFHSNVSGTLNVLESAKKFNVNRILYSASSSCYGIPSKYPTSEKSLIKPEYPYAFTKYYGELMLMHWSKVYNLNINSLRLFNVYGPNSRTSGTYGAMFGVFLAQKINKKPFTVVGSGKQKRDFVHVDDVCKAFLSVMKYGKKNNIYNVGSGKPISVNKIIKLIKGKKIHIPERPGEPFITHANIQKIKKDTKWKPEIGIEEGIKSLLKNINYWKKAPLWNPDSIANETSDWFKYLK